MLISRFIAALLLAAVLLPDTSRAEAPLTFEEISVMKRSGAKEAEIRKDVERRKLRFIISPEQKQQLKQFGLSAAFVDALDRPEYTIPREIIAELESQRAQLNKLQKDFAEESALVRQLLFEDSTETIETKKRLGIDKLQEAAKTQQASLAAQQAGQAALEARLRRIETMLEAMRK